MIFYGEHKGDGQLVLYARHAALMSKRRRGVRLRIEVKEDRNGKFNSLYHLMLGKVCEGLEAGGVHADIDDLKTLLKERHGLFTMEPHPRREGVMVMRYKSTSFATMDEEEFQRFVAKSCRYLAEASPDWLKDSPQWSEIHDILADITPGVA